MKWGSKAKVLQYYTPSVWGCVAGASITPLYKNHDPTSNPSGTLDPFLTNQYTKALESWILSPHDYKIYECLVVLHKLASPVQCIWVTWHLTNNLTSPQLPTSTAIHLPTSAQSTLRSKNTGFNIIFFFFLIICCITKLMLQLPQ